MAHNARDLRCRLRVDYFPEAVAALRKMVERFIEVLDRLDTAFVDVGLLDDLSQPGRLGAVRLGGIDLNRPRIRAVMNALLASSPSPRGFTASEVAARVANSLGDPHYTVSWAAHDLRKFRSKELVSRIPGSRRYTSSATAVAAIAAVLLLREKIIRPLLAAASSRKTIWRPRVASVLDERYRMRALCTTVGLAA